MGMPWNWMQMLCSTAHRKLPLYEKKTAYGQQSWHFSWETVLIMSLCSIVQLHTLKPFSDDVLEAGIQNKALPADDFYIKCLSFVG